MNGTNNSKSSFGNRVKDRRLALKISSHEKLAERMYPGAISLESMRKKVAKWESGHAEPSVSEFRRLCDILDCDPEYLWGIIDEPRRDTRSIMEISKLSQAAVEALLLFSTKPINGDHQFLSSAHILSLMLENPAFYRVMHDIYESVENHLDLETERMGKLIVSPEHQNEAETEYMEIVRVIKNLEGVTKKYGYSLISSEEWQNVVAFRMNQSIAAVVSDTITILHNECDSLIKSMLQQN